MMKNRTFLPNSDAAVLLWCQNFSTLLMANHDAYGIILAIAAAYAAKLGEYQSALSAAKADATRGKSTVCAKDLAKKSLIAMTRQIAGQISRTMSVTDQQKTDLGLIVRKKPSAIPAPTDRPTVALVSAIQRTVAVRVFDDSSATKRSKAPGAIGAKIYSYVGDSYPSDPTQWAYQGDSTRGKFDIVFPDSVANGSQVWICAAWFNRKGTGPVCVPISTNVQGGGAMQPATMKIAA